MVKAVVLLSGGLDSCVTATVARYECDELYAMSFLYGQKHIREIESAKKIAKFLNFKDHKFIKIDNSIFRKTALIDRNIDLPKKKLEEVGKEIPSTYVPGRNILFLSYANSYAESINADYIYIGVNALDYSGYPDCRPEFIKSYQKMIERGTKRGVEGNPIKIITPLLKLTKKEIVSKGVELGAPLHLTWSCYKGEEKACGECESCLLRLKGFLSAGYKDPIKYKKYPYWYLREIDKLKPIETYQLHIL